MFILGGHAGISADKKTTPSILLNPFPAQCRLLMYLRKKAFENIVGEGENAGNQQFLLLLQYFHLIKD